MSEARAPAPESAASLKEGVSGGGKGRCSRLGSDKRGESKFGDKHEEEMREFKAHGLRLLRNSRTADGVCNSQGGDPDDN